MFVPVVDTTPFSVTRPPTAVVDRPPAKLDVVPAAPSVSAPVLSKFVSFVTVAPAFSARSKTF